MSGKTRGSLRVITKVRGSWKTLGNVEGDKKIALEFKCQIW
jgi:hypothetical protein